MAFLPPEVGPAPGLELHPAEADGRPCGELVEEREGVLWRWDAVGRPGVYEVRRGEPVYAIAAGIPAVVSDLRSIEPELLQGRLAGGRDVRFRGAAGEGAGVAGRRMR